MKLTHLFIGAALLLAGTAAVTSCGSKNAANDETDSVEAVVPLTVEEFLAAEFTDGDTVTVEGLCSHLCKHGGTKAFLTDPDTTKEAQWILCMATDSIGGAFDPTCPGKVLTVTGTVRANTTSVSGINAAAERMKAQQEAGHCDSESKAFGTINQLKAALDSQMAVNPADTTLVLGYYIETTSYTLPVE